MRNTVLLEVNRRRRRGHALTKEFGQPHRFSNWWLASKTSVARVDESTFHELLYGVFQSSDTLNSCKKPICMRWSQSANRRQEVPLHLVFLISGPRCSRVKLTRHYHRLLDLWSLTISPIFRNVPPISWYPYAHRSL